MEKISTHWKDRIRLFAKERFGTITAMAEETGINANQLSFYTTGKRKPGWDVLAIWAGYGLNLTWLVTNQGEMWASEEHTPLENMPWAIPIETVFPESIPIWTPEAETWLVYVRKNLLESLESTTHGLQAVDLALKQLEEHKS